jgi:hypothetical protein
MVSFLGSFVKIVVERRIAASGTGAHGDRSADDARSRENLGAPAASADVRYATSGISYMRIKLQGNVCVLHPRATHMA